MKIAIDARKAGRSGIGVYIKNLVWSLAELDGRNEYLLLVNETSQAVARPAGRDNFRTVKINARIFSLLEQAELPGLLARERVELFHSTHFFLPVIKTCRTVVTIHDLMPIIFPHQFPWLKRHYLAWMIARSVRAADAIIAVSRHTRDDIYNHFAEQSPKNIRVIYEAPDRKPPPSPVENLSRFGLVPGGYLLYVGSDKFNKNLAGLLAAYNQLGSADKLPLVMAGGLKLTVIPQGVKLLGSLDDADLASLYNNARVLVMPSFYEGFGLPVLEAMAAGVPVVTANAASTAEIAGGAAWLADPYDARTIAAAIAEALRPGPARAEKIKLGLERAQEFSWAKAAAETLEVYNEIYQHS